MITWQIRCNHFAYLVFYDCHYIIIVCIIIIILLLILTLFYFTIFFSLYYFVNAPMHHAKQYNSFILVWFCFFEPNLLRSELIPALKAIFSCGKPTAGFMPRSYNFPKSSLNSLNHCFVRAKRPAD